MEVALSYNHVSIRDLYESPASFRAVETDTPDFDLLVKSIQARGILVPIVVRKLKNPETNEVFYDIIDGQRRWMAARKIGLHSVPIDLIQCDDLQALELQFILNNRPQTKPLAFHLVLLRLMAANPGITLAGMVAKLHVSDEFIYDRLNFGRLAGEFDSKIKTGRVCLANAYVLTRLMGKDEQLRFLHMAEEMSPQEFCPTVILRVREIRDAHRIKIKKVKDNAKKRVAHV